MRLAGQTAIITGGASGIGRATAILFAREGARVAIVDRNATAPEPGGLALVGDVADPATVAAHAATILAEFGRVDALVTAAGFSTGGTVASVALADWDAVIRTNLTGTFLWMRAVLPAMQAARRGSIVTISSQLARAGGRNNAAYIASKGAILSLTRTAALDLADDGIRVNAILPGAIDTPLLARSFARSATPDASRAASRARHPMARFGRAEEVAEAALYLASDASSFTTGTELVVDGGWLAG